MEIKTLVLGDIATNCYLLSTQKAAVVIDCGFYSAQTEQFLKQNSDKQRMILLTHSHFDHIADAARLRDITGTKIAIGKNDAEGLKNSALNLSDLFGISINPFEADLLLLDNQHLKVGDLDITVIETAGHTVGGVSYLVNGKLFSGDTLFCESVGRTDFPNGSFTVLKASIERLFTLPDSTEVYSGHGKKTFIGHEKSFNPFIKF